MLSRCYYFCCQVTGGSSGIGKCIAIECYKQGAFITLVARNEVSLPGMILPTYLFNFTLVKEAVQTFCRVRIYVGACLHPWSEEGFLNTRLFLLLRAKTSWLKAGQLHRYLCSASSYYTASEMLQILRRERLRHA